MRRLYGVSSLQLGIRIIPITARWSSGAIDSNESRRCANRMCASNTARSTGWRNQENGSCRSDWSLIGFMVWLLAMKTLLLRCSSLRGCSSFRRCPSLGDRSPFRECSLENRSSFKEGSSLREYPSLRKRSVAKRRFSLKKFFCGKRCERWDANCQRLGKCRVRKEMRREKSSWSSLMIGSAGGLWNKSNFSSDRNGLPMDRCWVRGAGVWMVWEVDHFDFCRFSRGDRDLRRSWQLV